MKDPWVFPIKSSVTGLGQDLPDIRSIRIDEDDSFVKGLRVAIIIGRCLGIISRHDVLRKNSTQKKITLPFLYTGFLAFFFLIYAILFIRVDLKRFKTIPTTIEKLGEITLPFYAFTVFYVYLYLLLATTRLRNIAQNFLAINQQYSGSPFPTTFPRFCWLISIIYLALGIAENIMYDVSNITKGRSQNITAKSTLELYYKSTYYHWADPIPYSPTFTLVLMAIVKIGTWGWVYGDVIAIILSKAITEKFRVINEEIKDMIKDSRKSDERALTLAWDEIRDEFLTLVELTKEIQKFIAPLIFSCFGYNMYSIMVNLFFWIAPSANFSVETSFYVDFAFSKFLFRVMTVTYFAAEVHHVSQSILGTVQRCPNSLFTMSLDRIEKTVARNPIGICLFGTFMITRNFFISILSFLFTTEIVLLQTTGSSSATYKAA